MAHKFSKDGKCLEISRENFRRKDDPLANIDLTNCTTITDLKFHHCKLNPKAVGEILMRLENVRYLTIDQCIARQSVYNQVPVVERALNRLTITLDLVYRGLKRGDFLDCHEILLHPKLRLPTQELHVNRMEVFRGGNDHDFDERYYERFDLEEERHSYMVSYQERYAKQPILLKFDNGRPRIWARVAKQNGLLGRRATFVKNLEKQEERLVSSTALNSAYRTWRQATSNSATSMSSRPS